VTAHNIICWCMPYIAGAFATMANNLVFVPMDVVKHCCSCGGVLIQGMLGFFSLMEEGVRVCILHIIPNNNGDKIISPSLLCTLQLYEVGKKNHATQCTLNGKISLHHLFSKVTAEPIFGLG